MTVPKKLEVSGAVTTGPIQPTAAPFPSGQSTLSLNSEQTPLADFNNAMSVSVMAPSFTDVLAGTGITNVKFIAMRVRNGTLVVRVTTAAAVDQEFSLSDTLVISNPTAGTEVTALAVQGTADLELMVTGDP